MNIEEQTKKKKKKSKPHKNSKIFVVVFKHKAREYFTGGDGEDSL